MARSAKLSKIYIIRKVLIRGIQECTLESLSSWQIKGVHLNRYSLGKFFIRGIQECALESLSSYYSIAHSIEFKVIEQSSGENHKIFQMLTFFLANM